MKAKKHSQPILFGLLLILLSVFFYSIHYLVFRDAHHIFIYLLGDIGFVFIEVLLVTLIIHELLSRREKKNVMLKLNMVIGVFYTRLGTDLLKSLAKFDSKNGEMTKHLVIEKNCSQKQFNEVKKAIAKHIHKIDLSASDLLSLKTLLLENSDSVLRLLENPNLLEHETFTELLWAVSHLSEELSHREDFSQLLESDKDHLKGDMTRAIRLVTREWLCYMEHLKNEYPYLFSLAIRTNPFDPDATVEVK